MFVIDSRSVIYKMSVFDSLSVIFSVFHWGNVTFDVSVTHVLEYEMWINVSYEQKSILASKRILW